MTTPPVEQHIVALEGPDSSGHWGGRCTTAGCTFDESGYEPDEVEERITRHGRLAADSPVPPNDEDEFAEEIEDAELALAMIGKAKQQILDLHTAAVTSMRDAARLLRETSAALPAGPWFTWPYDTDGPDDPDSPDRPEPEWAIRAGGRGEHVIVRARESHITAMGYLALFPPEIAGTLATRLDRAAGRVDSGLFTWAAGDVDLLEIARTYLKGIRSR